jgi:hypothetical protein
LENELDESEEVEEEKKPTAKKTETEKQTKVTADKTVINDSGSNSNNLAKTLLKNLPKEVETESKL